MREDGPWADTHVIQNVDDDHNAHPQIQFPQEFPLELLSLLGTTKLCIWIVFIILSFMEAGRGRCALVLLDVLLFGRHWVFYWLDCQENRASTCRDLKIWEGRKDRGTITEPVVYPKQEGKWARSPLSDKASV